MTHKLALPLFLFVCACSAPAQHKDFELPTMHAARGTRGALASGSEYADEAGMKMFFRGGNAVDAGVASMFAASVSEFSHFGMGGEAPILIRTKAGKVYAIAGVGPMPKLATAKFFLEHRPRPGEILTLDPGGLRGIIPVAGILPALVPSMVESGLIALRDFGTKSFSEAIEPAIDLADGMAIDETRSGAIARSRRFFDLWPDSKKTFLPDGRVPLPGEIFRQPNLARTLRSMAAAEKKALASGASRAAAIDAVADYFYRGEVAHRIDAFMQANGGLLRYEDMAAFKLQPEEPVSTEYRNYKVYKPGFWTQGPTMLETLNILEGFDLRSMGFNSADYIHTITEALKLAYADRDTYFGDPKFVNVPADTLLSKAYAAERRKEIGKTASMDFVPGLINGKRGKHPTEMDIARTKIDDALMASDTTCIDAIDKDGIVFSATPSGAWLPSVIAGDTGIPLTERAQQFILVPGAPNELAGGKRPRVTLSPTIITEQGKPFLALSTPGGDNQEQSLIQLFFNVVEFGENAQSAVEAPRFQTRHLIASFDNHAWNRGDLLLDERIPVSVGAELSTRGHKVGTRSRWASGAAPVMIRVTPDGVIEAGADPYGYRVAHAY
ncbi:MAG: gamma-glutamyltransferase family protein [Bryobacteraceae bacterium]|jgi:gamma-glutamyltranspeptidase/glutathione hydrolase